ncbi:MAG TPA: hypothetical protein VHT92_03070 [Candidatus Cybelea sp.]|jgi:hypothetical protein|nr:hypothetical protein [Candidatus Cybelea sp.]
MVRRAAGALALLALFGAVSAVAPAQALQRLTVSSFVLSSDTASPAVDVPFHLVLRLRVRQHVTRVENLNLPMLAQLELLGDMRETVSDASGTEYRETITVVAHTSGAVAVAPATLQAVDARDGRAKEWYTNGLTLRVGANRAQVAGTALRALLGLFLLVLGLALVVAIVAALARRPRVAAAPPPIVISPPSPTPPLVRTRAEVARDALAVLRVERDRASAVAVRAGIWNAFGAGEGETLGDVLRRPESGSETARALLIAIERSAFTYDSDLDAAIGDACGALQRYIEVNS